MKRFGNLYKKVYSINNLKLADKNARKGKTNNYDVQAHDLNKDDNIINLYHILRNKEYKTSKYEIYSIREPKERIIYKLPYYPCRIVHHSILNVLKPILLPTFTSNTFNCIKGRGIIGAYKSIRKSLLDIDNTQYCLKFDIKKYYPNIDHDILKKILRSKIKDRDFLWLLDEVIDSAPGCPIGNYGSQWFANLYLTKFDHWIKENKRVKYYFRYCDDIVILGKTKQELHILFKEIQEYLHKELKLEIKNNHQIFLVKNRGIDFVGYVFYHTHIMLRKNIKLRFLKMLKYNKNHKSIASYWGWLKYCNSINLINTHFKHD